MKDWFWKRKTVEAKPEPTTLEAHRSAYLPYTVTDAFKLGMGKSLGTEELGSLVSEELFPEATYLILKSLREQGLHSQHKELLTAYLNAEHRDAYKDILTQALRALPSGTRVAADKLTQLVMYGFDTMQDNFKAFFADIARTYPAPNQVTLLAHAPLVGVRHLAQVLPDAGSFVILTSKDTVAGYIVTRHGTSCTVTDIPQGFAFPQHIVVTDDFTRTGASFDAIKKTLQAYQSGITVDTRAMIDTSKA